MTRKTNTPTNDEEVRPGLALDPDEFRGGMAEFELTKEQEDVILQELWNIMRAIVDMGWGLDSVHIILAELFEKAGQDSGKLLQQTDIKIVKETVPKSAEGKDICTDE